jgi:hypothetical protein
MLYFKHSELVNKYHVSLKTVHNWIDAAKDGKFNLTLVERGSRTYIANTPQNVASLTQLATSGKKYRNTRFSQMAAPVAQFYDTFSKRQILDIISNLTIHREIPSQYNYIDGGAQNWHKWVDTLAQDSDSNYLNSTRELVRANLDQIDKLVGDTRKVNIIDLGVGNAYPSRELVKYLQGRGMLNRYIAIDISQSMLDIAEANVRTWFNGEVAFEGHVRDITYERFDDLLVDDRLADGKEQIVNLVLLLGGTPVNFRNFTDAFKVAYGSMEDGDLLIFTGKPDTESARHYFGVHHKQTAGYPGIYSFVLGLMGIDRSMYDIEVGYEERQRMRYIRVRFNTAVTIGFDFEDIKRSVQIEKGETVLLWRVWHMTSLEVITTLEQTGFVLLQASITKNRDRLITVLGIDTKSDNAELDS